ncbi:MAG TPA: hypothetical protein VGA37_06650 [Gemmatimonadales bacterium]
MREALARAGGVAARGAVEQRAREPVAHPFASARVLEGARMAALPVGDAHPAPDGSGFVDGIQRLVVDGHYGLVPVIRGHVAAAVLERVDGVLSAVATEFEEFLVVPVRRLSAPQHTALEQVGLAVYDSDPGARPHPIVDRYAALQVIERRRERAELAAAGAFLRARPGGWLFRDGSIGGLAALPGGDRVVGLVKSHETQFLDGEDLVVALTLPEGCRSGVFERIEEGRRPMLTWYLRLWPWSELDLLHGLMRVERCPGDHVIAEAGDVSRWLLAERTPISAPDARWDRLIYPIHEVEMYLRARVGGWG